MSHDPFSKVNPWYALQVRPRSEKLASDILRNKSYEPFLPSCIARHRWSDRYQNIELPLFPGYVFCRFDVYNRLPVLTTPGVLQVVGLGKIPIPIDDSEIDAIRAVIASGLAAHPYPFLRAGSRVRIQEGPLHGVEGIFATEKGRGRLVVSVTLLQRSIAVEIDRAWIRPL